VRCDPPTEKPSLNKGPASIILLSQGANGLRISRAATTKKATSQESYLRTRFTRRYQPRKRRRLHALVSGFCKKQVSLNFKLRRSKCNYYPKISVVSKKYRAMKRTFCQAFLPENSTLFA
jgi:hypothetical protein